MKITQYLKDEQIVLELSASTKEGAVKELAETLRANPAVTDLDAFVRDALQREEFSTTGIGHDVAIPHARTDAVTDIVIAFGRAPGGLDFESLDGRPVKLIFLIGTPKRKNLSTYLSVLAHLTRLLEKESFRESLLEAESPSAAIEAVQSIEE